MSGDEDQVYSFENILEMWLKWLPLPSEIKFNQGEVQEWLNWHAWKVCKLERVSRVRIPSSPRKARPAL